MRPLERWVASQHRADAVVHPAAAEHDHHAREQAARPATPPEPGQSCIAIGPGQVFTWDLTKLPGPTEGVYFDAYVLIDIYSRYIVGAHVHLTEAAVLAEEMTRTFSTSTASRPWCTPTAVPR